MKVLWMAALAGLVMLAGCERPPSCPPGAKLMGEMPPKGSEVWCEKTVNGKPVKDGVFIIYQENGYKMIEGTYHNDKQDGVWTLWYENGQKHSIDHYRDGVQQGKHTEWYPNGRISAMGQYVDGKREGTWKRWDAQGFKNWEEVYRNGKRVS